MKAQINITIEKDSENCNKCSRKCKFLQPINAEFLCLIWQKLHNGERLKECLAGEV